MMESNKNVGYRKCRINAWTLFKTFQVFFFNLHDIFGVKDVYDFGKEKYGWVMQFFCA